MNSPSKVYETFVGPFDPCPPIRCKSYVTPPHLYMNYQPMCLPQFTPKEALMKGTLWPALFSSYERRN
ncbi:spore coat associated protein CotJA [Paenibacillus psychroresistens]|uniref:Spore coat associated protein CotJA n=1 Tax=Paenibacillus psychroresistens TaxID=1778678 RepID=A0A6B8RQ49_9BACL|nr:spore coat associated protein CotJA [Paenibacillus psychroresistens]QGQ97822.1 spore coat associated protein CotJA [Paenibacillus psychroresistens]